MGNVQSTDGGSPSRGDENDFGLSDRSFGRRLSSMSRSGSPNSPLRRSTSNSPSSPANRASAMSSPSSPGSSSGAGARSSAAGDVYPNDENANNANNANNNPTSSGGKLFSTSALFGSPVLRQKSRERLLKRSPSMERAERNERSAAGTETVSTTGTGAETSGTTETSDSNTARKASQKWSKNCQSISHIDYVLKFKMDSVLLAYIFSFLPIKDMLKSCPLVCSAFWLACLSSQHWTKLKYYCLKTPVEQKIDGFFRLLTHNSRNLEKLDMRVLVLNPSAVPGIDVSAREERTQRSNAINANGMMSPNSFMSASPRSASSPVSGTPPVPSSSNDEASWREDAEDGNHGNPKSPKTPKSFTASPKSETATASGLLNSTADQFQKELESELRLVGFEDDSGSRVFESRAGSKAASIPSSSTHRNSNRKGLLDEEMPNGASQDIINVDIESSVLEAPARTLSTALSETHQWANANMSNTNIGMVSPFDQSPSKYFVNGSLSFDSIQEVYLGTRTRAGVRLIADVLSLIVESVVAKRDDLWSYAASASASASQSQEASREIEMGSSSSSSSSSSQAGGEGGGGNDGPSNSGSAGTGGPGNGGNVNFEILTALRKLSIDAPLASEILREVGMLLRQDSVLEDNHDDGNDGENLELNENSTFPNSSFPNSTVPKSSGDESRSSNDTGNSNESSIWRSDSGYYDTFPQSSGSEQKSQASGPGSGGSVASGDKFDNSRRLRRYHTSDYYCTNDTQGPLAPGYRGLEELNLYIRPDLDFAIEYIDLRPDQEDIFSLMENKQWIKHGNRRSSRSSSSSPGGNSPDSPDSPKNKKKKKKKSSYTSPTGREISKETKNMLKDTRKKVLDAKRRRFGLRNFHIKNFRLCLPQDLKERGLRRGFGEVENALFWDRRVAIPHASALLPRLSDFLPLLENLEIDFATESLFFFLRSWNSDIGGVGGRPVGGIRDPNGPGGNNATAAAPNGVRNANGNGNQNTNIITDGNQNPDPASSSDESSPEDGFSGCNVANEYNHFPHPIFPNLRTFKFSGSLGHIRSFKDELFLLLLKHLPNETLEEFFFLPECEQSLADLMQGVIAGGQHPTNIESAELLGRRGKVEDGKIKGRSQKFQNDNIGNVNDSINGINPTFRRAGNRRLQHHTHNTNIHNLKKSKGLRRLEIDYIYITDDFVRAFVNHCPDIEVLRLNSCDLLTDDAIQNSLMGVNFVPGAIQQNQDDNNDGNANGGGGNNDAQAAAAGPRNNLLPEAIQVGNRPRLINNNPTHGNPNANNNANFRVGNLKKLKILRLRSSNFFSNNSLYHLAERGHIDPILKLEIEPSYSHTQHAIQQLELSYNGAMSGSQWAGVFGGWVGQFLHPFNPDLQGQIRQQAERQENEANQGNEQGNNQPNQADINQQGNHGNNRAAANARQNHQQNNPNNQDGDNNENNGLDDISADAITFPRTAFMPGINRFNTNDNNNPNDNNGAEIQNNSMTIPLLDGNAAQGGLDLGNGPGNNGNANIAHGNNDTGNENLNFLAIAANNRHLNVSGASSIDSNLSMGGAATNLGVGDVFHSASSASNSSNTSASSSATSSATSSDSGSPLIDTRGNPIPPPGVPGVTPNHNAAHGRLRQFSTDSGSSSGSSSTTGSVSAGRARVVGNANALTLRPEPRLILLKSKFSQATDNREGRNDRFEGFCIDNK